MKHPADKEGAVVASASAPDFPVARRRAGVVGAAGAGLLLVGACFTPTQFFFSYLAAWLFWAGIVLGGFGLLTIHHLTGGEWGFLLRRPLEAGLRTLPAVAALFLPLFFGLGRLYSWARPGAGADDPTLRHKLLYLNVPAFALRMVVLFGLWWFLARRMDRLSAAQDATPDPEPTRRLRTTAGPGLVLYALTTTFALVDWVMVLENDWYSSIFPVQGAIGQMLTALAFSLLLTLGFARRGLTPWAAAFTAERRQTLASLLLAFTLLWVYMALSQLIIIWSGNLPKEITWYLHRSAGGWRGVVLFLAAFHFAVPFALLLFRGIKRNAALLGIIAAGLLGVQAVANGWYVLPSLHRDGLHVSWLDPVAFVAVGGVWLWAYLGQLARRPPLPLRDPRLPKTGGFTTPTPAPAGAPTSS